MKKLFTALAIGAVAVLGLSACTSDADRASYNLSHEADNFNVQRLIVGINGVTDEILFSVEGKCSLNLDRPEILEITCKHGPDDYRKHFMGLSDNVTYTSTQLEGVDVSVYNTKITLKPTNIIPDFDLSVGKE